MFAKGLPGGADDVTNKLYVAGVSWETSNDGLFNFFAKYGTVVSAQIQRDHVTGRSRGFGFVTFADKSSCEKVLAEQQNLSLDSRKLEIKYAVPKGQAPTYDGPSVTPGGRPKKIYIAGISMGTTEEDLREHFAQFGKIIECYIQKDRTTGESRGFGFLTYDSADSVDKVLAKPSQKIGEKCIVDVKVARPKGEGPPGTPSWSSFGGTPTTYTPSYTAGGYSAPSPGYAPTTGYTPSWGVDSLTQLGSARVADGYGPSIGGSGSLGTHTSGLGATSGLGRQDYSQYQQSYDYSYGGLGTGAGTTSYSDPSGLGVSYNQWTGATTATLDDSKRVQSYDYGTALSSTTGGYDPTTGQYTYGTTPTPAYDPSQAYSYGAIRRTTPTTTPGVVTPGVLARPGVGATQSKVGYHPYAR